MHRVRVKARNVAATATLADTMTARAFWDGLPITGRGMRWGDEIYFDIPLDLGEENPRATVGMGDIAFWAPGNALCILFGPTPVSGPGEIRPASPVTILGRIDEDARAFSRVPDGSPVAIEPIEPSGTTER